LQKLFKVGNCFFGHFSVPDDLTGQVRNDCAAGLFGAELPLRR
jgi:hypothetical protein